MRINHILDGKRGEIQILQVNLGKKCNQSCHHCHQEAGPKRAESMNFKTIEKVLSVLATTKIPLIDVTGGAPELNPHFKYLVSAARQLGCQILVRTNLTVIFEKEQDCLPEFFKQNKVELICSLPCYLEKNVDSQRGTGVFNKSIKALQILNALGYGKERDLKLHLVYNPLGPTLPPDQKILEESYRKHLKENYHIVFNSLYTLTNMPIGRFDKYLKSTGQKRKYLSLLKNSLNRELADRIMCRTMISVGWDGTLYDCDFNQALNLFIGENKPFKINHFDIERLIGTPIKFAEHCFACIAGQGSSCQGALAEN
jgi:radical SAM/Cys-rich protein